jgi:outer membrane receptor protein involved in Fe transport
MLVISRQSMSLDQGSTIHVDVAFEAPGTAPPRAGSVMMTGLAFRSCILLASTALPSTALAQAGRAPEQVIIVTAPRSLPAPVRQLGREDIDGYGAGSIGELLGEVLDEEGEDAPVILINGRRASGLEELSDYPPEALDRVEVLAAGSGPEVGASPTRKVVNLVLKRRFDGQVGRTALRAATEGGFTALRADGTYTRIRGRSRLNLNLRTRSETALTEAERDIVQPAGSLPGEAAARTLLPSVRATDLSLSGSTQLGADTDLSGTGRLSFTGREARLGLTPLGLTREQEGNVLGGRLNTTLNAEAAGWTLALLGTLDADRRKVVTDFDLASRRSVIRSLATSLDVTAVRSILQLPAGALQLNLGASLASDHFRSTGAEGLSSFTERTAGISAGLVVPVAGGPDDFLPPLGELTLSLDAGLSRIEGGGSFTTGSLGLVWEPLSWVRISGGLSRSTSPPAARFRREAALVTPGVLVFDPLTGGSVRVDEISGPLGITARPRSEQERLSVTLTPPSSIDLRLESEFSRRRERDVVGDLPLASSLVLEAFPDRFLRDSSGTLTAVDVSPVLFPARSESQWRNALSLRFRLGGSAPAEQGAIDDESGGGDDAAPRGRATRLQLLFAHTLLLSSRLTLREGLAPIDLLSGNAVLFAGGRPRHQLDLSANLTRAGLGLRLNAAYRSRSVVGLTDLAGAPTQLRFGALGTLSARAFAEADRLFGRSALTKGTRLSLSVNNLTNAREEVRDRFGITPLPYQPAFRDALGRTIELEIRRRF